MAAVRPNLLQYIAYSYGRCLPDSMREWVAQDLSGRGAIRRHIIRMAIPPLLVLAPLWLLPASLYVHLEMTAPIYIWSILDGAGIEQGVAPAPTGPARPGPKPGRRDQPGEAGPHPRGLRAALRAATGIEPVAGQQQSILSLLSQRQHSPQVRGPHGQTRCCRN